MARITTYYDTLQVSRFANEAVIRAAYRTLCQKYHPDKNPDTVNAAHRDMKRLNEAYAVLSDSTRRAAYDQAVEERENEILQQENLARKPAEAATERYREQQSQTEQKSSTQKGGEQGSSRFDQSAANEAPPTYRNHYTPHPRKAGTVFTAFFQGFKDGKKSDKKTGPGINAASSDGLTFWNVLVICLVGAWILAMESSKNMRSGHADLPFFSLLFNPGFLGIAAAPAMLLGACASVGWIIGSTVPALRRLAPMVGLVFAVCAFFIVLSGGQMQKANLERTAAENPKPSPIVTAPPRANPNEQQLYSEALKEIEARHPVLNPDLPGHRKDLIVDAVSRMNKYAKQGIAKHDALRRAIADMEREASAAPQPPPTYTNPPVYTPPATYASQRTSTRDLSVQELTTISMACGDYQINGDVSRYQSCMREKTALAQSGTPVPSMSHLTIGEQTTINMACGEYQINGDVSRYQSCMREKTALAQSGIPAPSMSHLTIGEQSTINMACSDHQINGDVSRYQSCMRSNVSKITR